MVSIPVFCSYCINSMDVRVRLVFVDEVGCHVRRHRGLSSCWYLIPKEVKLVGDLTHVLLREFGLSTSCSKGLELYLDELRVLATQSIRIVRDNDTIVVQCPLSDKEQGDDGSETLNLKRKAEKLTLRKRKAREKKEEKEPCKKKVKVMKDGLKVLKEKLKDEVKKSGKSKAVTLLGSKKNILSSSSESASSSSSCSESSSSESEDESSAQCNRKKVVQVTTIKKQLLDKRKDAATTCRKKLGCNEVASKTNAVLEKSETKPRRRRRRRLRQRNGGRQRSSNQTSTADNSASAALSTGDKDTASQEQVVATPQLLKQTLSTERQNSSDSAGAKGKRCGKMHVLFDEETGDQVEVKHNEHRYDARESVEPTQRSPAPELAKYGPSSSIKQFSRIVRDNRGRLVDGGEEVNVYNNVPKREEKGKYVERWKRPYKIVATVLDKKSEKSASLTTDLTKLLSMYPTAPATLFDFVLKDVVAFKTLTLCLETWQPVLSEWQCGQVQSVDASGNAILLSKWMLAANGDSIDFREARDAEQYSVQTSEISELRFLSGSSYTSLQQTEEQDAK